MRRLFCILAATVVTSSLARAQTRPAPAFSPIVTRVDVVDAEHRFDQTFAQHPAAESDMPRVNRSYDVATSLIYNGRYSEAIHQLNQLTASLLPAPPTPAERYLASLKIRVGPLVSQVGRPTPLKIKVSGLYETDVTTHETIDSRLVIRADDGKTAAIVDQPLKLVAGAAPPVVTIPQPNAAIGAYLVQIVAPNGSVVAQTRWNVALNSLDAFRQTNALRLRGMYNLSPTMAQALGAAIARNNLLSDQPDESDPGRWAVNPIELSMMVDSEIQLLLKGEDPYSRRIGDTWRTVQAGVMQVPVRIYAPEAAGSDTPIGLLIALSDAGGDESTFMDGCGLGQIRKLADDNSLIVVTPNTDWVLRNPGSLESIIIGIGKDYAIDTHRIYLLGHSLGAVPVAQMTKNSTISVTAAVCIAGECTKEDGKTKCPPTRVYAGELDGIIPLSDMESQVNVAKSHGLPIELVLIKGYGHTLIVDRVIPDAIKWLATHTK
jgi:hypothetical protein